MQQLIVITDFEQSENEHSIINEMFRIGLQCLHLRKPSYNIETIKFWLEKIDAIYHPYITVYHRYFKDLQSFNISQVHFPEADRLVKATPEYLNMLQQQGVQQFSTSIHQATSYQNLNQSFDYTFISPVFDSISKSGYRAINEAELTVLQNKLQTKIIALGGIDKNNCTTALQMGFDGVAVLGAIWKNYNPLNAFIDIYNELQ